MMRFGCVPVEEAMQDTSLRGDLALPDHLLEARYQQQWREFERSHWWPWYERWGTEFFRGR